jgi:3-isopropylmalate/(R)-2-methylmalate dehydratase large subunit
MYDCRPLKEFEERPIDQAYLGSCDSGRLDDLRLAAKVMKGHRKHPDVRLSIVPTTNKIMLEAAREGLLEMFIEAGAWVTAPTCDFCFGVLDPMAEGEVCIATATVNFPGRMGSTKAEIFLANPASVVASAIEGKIADPRKYL